MSRQGRTTEAMALEVASKLGIDVEALKKEAASAQTEKTLAATRRLADDLSVQGTPLFVIGHNGIAGTPDDWKAKLAGYVAEVRSKGCDVC